MRSSAHSLRRGLLMAFLVVAVTGTVAGIVMLLIADEPWPEGRAVALMPSPAPSPESPAAAAEQPTEEPVDVAEPVAPPPAAGIAIGRVVIPKIGVDAPLVAKGVDASGHMQVPDSPEEVALYDFAGRPGEGANIVLAGHVDYHNYGPAVFARLRDLTLGDIVEVRLEGGGTYDYVVTQSVAYEAQGAPIEEIVGPTSRETVTLITCDGTFNGASLGYSHRLVVRAERL